MAKYLELLLAADWVRLMAAFEVVEMAISTAVKMVLLMGSDLVASMVLL